MHGRGEGRSNNSECSIANGPRRDCSVISYNLRRGLEKYGLPSDISPITDRGEACLQVKVGFRCWILSMVMIVASDIARATYH